MAGVGDVAVSAAYAAPANDCTASTTRDHWLSDFIVELLFGIHTSIGHANTWRVVEVTPGFGALSFNELRKKRDAKPRYSANCERQNAMSDTANRCVKRDTGR